VRALWLLPLVIPAPAAAQSLVPGPAQPGSNPALHDLAISYDRQFHTFNASPFGLSLDAFVPDQNDRSLVSAFLAQTAEPDFLAFTTSLGTPRTVGDVISEYDEHGDLGMFGGVPAAAEAFRYAILRDGGAAAALVDAARNDLLEAIASFHVYAEITGEPGTIARGIRRITEPGPAPEPLPATCADPWDRGANVWRSDQSGRHPDWYWMDNTSKDQMIGYVFALGAFWDVIASDPSIPQSVKDDLSADALALGRSLMELVEVRAGTSIDLVIRDANGCITRHHELNPREVPLDGAQPIVFDETSTNRIGFNALAALGIIRTLYHITGDATLRSYYYDELVTARGYPAQVMSGAARLRNMFANVCVGSSCVVTNFSNVNMAFVSIYGVLRYETDPALRTTYQTILEGDLWDGPRPHMGLAMQQAFFNLLYAGFRAGATDDTQANNAVASLAEWPAPPYWHAAVENCDTAEISAGSCIAIDGTTTITLDEVAARGGGAASETALPKRLRVPNNFEWRSDPRVVNGGGGDRLNPGGDFRAAYWLGRFLVRSSDSDDNVSPIARNPDGSGGPTPIGTDAGVVMDAAGTDALSGEDATAEPDAGEMTDAGTPIDAETPAKDAGDADSGMMATSGADAAVDAGMRPSDPIPSSESCGCTAHPSGPPSPHLLLALGLLFAVRRRRA
jgi:MYXO-CTERM domain-containing protein